MAGASWGRPALFRAALIGALGCSSRPSLPSGSAPEYERPTLPPWDAGASASPRLGSSTDGGRADGLESRDGQR
jgi:hypothetical protein